MNLDENDLEAIRERVKTRWMSLDRAVQIAILAGLGVLIFAILF
ncbi:gp79 [Alphaproteobacteria phage PhiJL001]|uniref:Gp79 n=1 Tax=Alphaproteobacteria phage PhiJL001 TaxID=2681607 RepID=Q5DN26_9CAUD|nr:gp79 [Alphaproteobacteria phage PhiJL001]AAT69469.1 gp79 [Alphaproteobacteria phage PhiJL001]